MERNESSPTVRVFWLPLTREELLARLRDGAARLAGQLPVRRIVLFGSWATGRATAASDVDVLVCYAGPPRPDAFALAWRAFTEAGVPRVEPHVYSETEAQALAPQLAKMTQQGLVIWESAGEAPDAGAAPPAPGGT